MTTPEQTLMVQISADDLATLREKVARLTVRAKQYEEMYQGQRQYAARTHEECANRHGFQSLWARMLELEKQQQPDYVENLVARIEELTVELHRLKPEEQA